MLTEVTLRVLLDIEHPDIQEEVEDAVECLVLKDEGIGFAIDRAVPARQKFKVKSSLGFSTRENESYEAAVDLARRVHNQLCALEPEWYEAEVDLARRVQSEVLTEEGKRVFTLRRG